MYVPNAEGILEQIVQNLNNYPTLTTLRTAAFRCLPKYYQFKNPLIVTIGDKDGNKRTTITSHALRSWDLFPSLAEEKSFEIKYGVPPLLYGFVLKRKSWRKYVGILSSPEQYALCSKLSGPPDRLHESFDPPFFLIKQNTAEAIREQAELYAGFPAYSRTLTEMNNAFLANGHPAYAKAITQTEFAVYRWYCSKIGGSALTSDEIKKQFKDTFTSISAGYLLLGTSANEIVDQARPFYEHDLTKILSFNNALGELKEQVPMHLLYPSLCALGVYRRGTETHILNPFEQALALHDYLQEGKFIGVDDLQELLQKKGYAVQEFS